MRSGEVVGTLTGDKFMATATVGYKSIYKKPFDISKPECVQITLTIYTDTKEEETVALELAEEMHQHRIDLAQLIEMRVLEGKVD